MLASVTIDWVLGYTIGTLVVAAVVCLLVPVYILAIAISEEATIINQSLEQSVRNTSALTGLKTTIKWAEIIVAGLYRARKRLGG
ncbi:MAG: hypothetical protein ACRD0E_02115 [Acidimicrobiales bacterium]